MALIACVDLDPFLIDLVRRLRPDDVVEEVAGHDLPAGRPRRFGAVVMAAGSSAVEHLGDDRLAARTILVVREGGRVPPSHPGPVLRRPVDAADLRVAVASVLPSGRLGGLGAGVRALAVSTSVDGVFSVARVAAVAAASALVLTTPTGDRPTALLVVLLIWALLRVWVREQRTSLVTTDLVLAGLAIALTPGGPTGGFILFAAVTAAEIGYAFSSRVGAAIVALGTLGGLVPIVVDIARGAAEADSVLAWAALVPLSSIIGVLARRIQRSGESGNVEMLRELHDTLDRLSKQAQGVAGTLDTASVLTQIEESLREDVGATAGVVLLGVEEVHDVAWSFGLRGQPPPRLPVVAAGRRPDVPPAIQPLLPAGTVLVARLSSKGVHAGLLAAVVPDVVPRQEAEVALHRLAEEGALALQNARLFASIRELTIDEERRRIARDLHDGVVQSLVHVRFELDLVQRFLDDEHADDIARLRDVVGHAVEEVRGTVNDLRSVRLSAGLGTALTALARELERPDLRIVVDAGPAEDLSPEAALQLLRIAQEAISNAIHHGKSSVVVVRLWHDDHQAHLQVLDDGVGMEPVTVPADRGVGLQAMQERADLIGADLDFGPGADGGTCVQVDVPLGRPDS